MSSNKKAKEELIRYYGAECFIEKLHLRKDNTPRHYTSKGQMKKNEAIDLSPYKNEKRWWQSY